MSHFVCFVFGQNIEEQLEKYDENNRYLVDSTDEWNKRYETDTIVVIRDDKGNLHRMRDDIFWIPLSKEEEKAEKEERGFIPSYGHSNILNTTIISDGIDRIAKKLVIPDGWEKVSIPVKQMFSFKEFMVNHNEYPAINENGSSNDSHVILDKSGQIKSVIDFTNPDAQWDWYQIGGRWSNFLKTKNTEMVSIEVEYKGKYPWEESQILPMTKNHLISVEHNDKPLFVRADEVVVGDKIIGIGDDCKKEVVAVHDGEFVNQAYVKDVDFHGMIEEYKKNLEKDWEKVHSVVEPFADKPFATWEDIFEKYKEKGEENYADKAREEYNNQPVIKAIHNANVYEEPTDYFLPKEEFVKKHQYDSITPYAFVENGKWFSKGKMGWWGVSDDKITVQEWQEKVWDKISKMDGDTVITVVDCHI